MCAVSMISTYYMEPQHPSVPNPYRFDNETKQALREIVRRLDELDKKLNDRECVDELKEQFFAIIEYSPTK